MKPAFLFDGRNIVNVKQAQTIGFHVEKIGRQSSHGKIGVPSAATAAAAKVTAAVANGNASNGVISGSSNGSL